ncbi:MAG: BamA/TamA family outer membrane protein [Bacteroidetes bacterium]|nr:BamA/TamA family outer membrane protein [Bacteroidota bacterium]
MVRRAFAFSLILFVHTINCKAQTPVIYKVFTPAGDTILIDSMRSVIIDNFFVTGNKKTHEGYILRELSVKKGESFLFKDLRKLLDRDAQKIFNLRIFEESHTNVILKENDLVDIEVKVRERWYLWPIPIFRIADRNFNAWWSTRERDLSRLLYGVTLDHSNIRGRGERLRLTAQFGFTRNFQLFYSKPYIDKERKYGFAALFGFTEFKNLAYQSRNDEFDFLSIDKGLLREAYSAAVAFNYRPNFFTRHGLSLGYLHNNIADTIAVLNPEYLLDGRRKQQAFWVGYSVIYDNRDLVYYPLKGTYFSFVLNRTGMGIYNDVGIWSTEARFTKLFDLGKNFYYASHFQVNASAPFRQPFINQQRMGFFENFVRGYELSVVEGPIWLLNRNTIRKRLFKDAFRIRNFTKMDQFASLPLGLYLGAFIDIGWAEKYPNTDSRFNNTLLLGTGLGLDIVTFYDIVIRLEYSYNLEKETNFFLNVRAAI